MTAQIKVGKIFGSTLLLLILVQKHSVHHSITISFVLSMYKYKLETIIHLDPEIVSICTKIVGWDVQHKIKQCAGPRSAVGNVSGYRFVSDCRTWVPEFDPGPVPSFVVEINHEIASYM